MTEGNLKFIIVILVILLLILGGTMLKDNYQENQEIKMQKVFNNGTIYGSQLVLYEISSKAIKCEPYYITLNNNSIAVSEVRCP